MRARPYEGYVWVRADEPTAVAVSLESRDGSRSYAETTLQVSRGDWQRLDFTLTPAAADRVGRFAVKLKRPGTVVVGHAFLQPGDWGRFKGLPVRRDVAEGLIDQGITVLRYGGSMVNTAEYRWKKMIGPRDRRPPYAGHWYRYSSNGWGILDFMNFCEAAGFEYVPAFNIDEKPQDLADFIEYAKGPADSEWGRKRTADGHPKPYRLPYMELGNEERVDDKYAAKFEALATRSGPSIGKSFLSSAILLYDRPITIRYFTGAASKITNLKGQQRFCAGPKYDREVWFDVHVDTDGPGLSPSLKALPTYIDALANSPSAPSTRSWSLNSTPATTPCGGHRERPGHAGSSATAACRSSPPPTACNPTVRTTMAGTRAVVPQSVAGLATAARLCHANDLPQRPSPRSFNARSPGRPAG